MSLVEVIWLHWVFGAARVEAEQALVVEAAAVLEAHSNQTSFQGQSRVSRPCHPLIPFRALSQAAEFQV
jgi:hypothetical protein